MRFRFGIAFLFAALIIAAGCKKPSPTRDRPLATRGTPPAKECRDGSEWRQRYGTSCVCCHQEFGVAGSVAHDAGVATILVRDRDGKELEMAPNPFDNFFRHAPVKAPLRAQIVLESGEVRTMQGDAPHGSCNACHGDGEPLLGAR